MLRIAPSLLVAVPLLIGSARAQAPGGMVLVPAGEFVMGDDSGALDERPAHRVDLPAYFIDRHEVTNAQFARFARERDGRDPLEGPWFRFSIEGCLDQIDRYRKLHRTTFDQFAAAGTASGATPDGQRSRRADAARWKAALMALRHMLGRDESFPGATPTEDLAALPEVRALISSQAKLPVRNVTWRDARSYARWAGKRLPTEAEWEKAARGTDERRYPWGNPWHPERCRAGLAPSRSAIFDPHRPESAERTAPEPVGPAAVGSHPEGASPFGCLDMAGNLWEWTADWYGETYYTRSEGARDPPGPVGLDDGRLPEPYSSDALLRSPEQGRSPVTRKVIRGGGWSGPPARSWFDTRCTRRLWSNPGYWHADVGFRCAMDAP